MGKNNVRIRMGRVVYLLLAIIFACCMTIQIFFAGMAIFMSPAHWVKHTTFVHLFGFNIPVLLLVFAFVGSLPSWAYWQTFGLFVSIYLMYFTANVTAIVPWVGAMHLVVAMILFVLSWIIVLKTWRLIFDNRARGKHK